MFSGMLTDRKQTCFAQFAFEVRIRYRHLPVPLLCNVHFWLDNFHDFLHVWCFCLKQQMHFSEEKKSNLRVVVFWFLDQFHVYENVNIIILDCIIWYNFMTLKSLIISQAQRLG